MSLSLASPAIVDQLVPVAMGWTLVLFRVSGLFLALPLLTSAMVPMQWKALLAACLAAAIFPLVASRVPTPEVGSIPELIPLVAFELLIGFVIGSIASIPLLMMELAGMLAGTTMGFGLARVYNPDTQTDQDLLGQLLFFVAVAVFLTLGGLDHAVRAVVASFEALPPGSLTLSVAGVLDAFVAILTTGFELGLRVAAPVIALVFLVIIVTGVLGKTMPQLNVLTVGFSIKLLLGIGVLALGIYAVHEPVKQEVLSALRAASQVTGPRPIPGTAQEGA